MKKLKEQMFDFEVYADWWCCVIGKYAEDDYIPESIKDDFIVVSSDDATPRETLLAILKEPGYVSMGYNIKRYDNIILNAIASGLTPKQLKIVNDIIIHPEKEYDSIEHMRLAQFAKRRYNKFIYQDLMDDNTGSLKEKEACMQLDIREADIPFERGNLTNAEKASIISYCKHDVWSTMMFYKLVVKPFVMSKLLVGKIFNLPVDICYKSTNANLSAAALGAMRKSFPDRDRQDIVIPQELKQYITYSLPSSVIDRLCESPKKFEVELFDNVVSYSNGGIHSVPIRPAEIKVKSRFPAWLLHVKSGNGWSLINIDADSFYPNLMAHWKTLSRTIPNPEKFLMFIMTRLALKPIITEFENKYGRHPEKASQEEYDKYIDAKETSQAYKLILNTTFGASNNKYLPLYDPYMTTCTCRLGQLLLTALANNLYNQIGKDNIRIIQTNTDGILIYINDNYRDLLAQICAEWERTTKISLEFEEEYQIWQRDVNNYIMAKQNGKVKTKGGYFVTDMQQPGHNRVRPLDNYVCREAMIEFLTHDKDIMSHIYAERDISKFIITCNKGVFKTIVREFTDGSQDEVLHNCNRAYASLNKKFGEIKKTKTVNGEIRKYKAPGCPPHCGLINEDLSKRQFSEYVEDIDYTWYIIEAYRMLDVPFYKMLGNKMIKDCRIDNLFD